MILVGCKSRLLLLLLDYYVLPTSYFECAIVQEEKRKEVDELEGLKSVRPSFFYLHYGGSARGLFYPPQITNTKSY